jgi:hypothetical protein
MSSLFIAPLSSLGRVAGTEKEMAIGDTIHLCFLWCLLPFAFFILGSLCAEPQVLYVLV